jgi:hypothetical protein
MEYIINLNPSKCIFMVLKKWLLDLLFEKKVINYLIQRKYKQ